MSYCDPIHAAHAAALARWSDPFPGFASGHDRRTSDEGLLGVTHGGLDHAARHDWLNAGRRLIDKTFIDMLWHVQGLTGLRGIRAEQVAADLDTFIDRLVKPAWHGLPHLSADERALTSNLWTEEMAAHCFGSLYCESAASRLLFFLVPMLPMFNLSRGHRMALDRLGHGPRQPGYRAYAHAAASAYHEYLPRLAELPGPSVRDAERAKGALMSQLLSQTDWWTRRVFDEYLRGLAPRRGNDGSDLFGSENDTQPS